jgi:hypothetical protein
MRYVITDEMYDYKRDARANIWQNIVFLNKEYDLGTINIVAKDLAYFAGIFDTEVHFNLDSPHSIRISYDKNNVEFLKILSNVFGGKIYKEKPRPERKIDVWKWVVDSDQSYKILKKIYPFLRIRREKARLCTECYENISLPGLNIFNKAKIGAQYIQLIKDCEPKPEQRFNYFGLPHLKSAYLAGIFDVDSSFVITRRTESGRNSYLLEVIKRKNDHETMEFIAGVFGGKIHRATKSTLNKQDIWEIKYTSQKAYAVLKQIYPYLIAQKRIAEICMEFQDKYYQGNTKGAKYNTVSPERRALGENYAGLLKTYHLKWRSRYDKYLTN